MGPVSLNRGGGFGLGFTVNTTGPNEGIYWWVGVANTWFWIDPVENIIAFAWTQSAPFLSAGLNPLMRRLVYESIVESNRVPAGRN